MMEESMSAALKRRGGKAWFWLSCAISSALAAGFLFAVHLPLREELALAREESAICGAEILEIENFMNENGDMKVYEAEALKKKELADRALPDMVNESALVAFINGCAASRNLSLLSAIPGRQAADRGISVIPIQIKLRCDYFQLMDFLGDIDGSGRYLEVGNLSVKGVDGELECKMDIIAYSMDGGSGT